MLTLITTFTGLMLSILFGQILLLPRIFMHVLNSSVDGIEKYIKSNNVLYRTEVNKTSIKNFYKNIFNKYDEYSRYIDEYHTMAMIEKLCMDSGNPPDMYSKEDIIYILSLKLDNSRQDVYPTLDVFGVLFNYGLEHTLLQDKIPVE